MPAAAIRDENPFENFRHMGVLGYSFMDVAATFNEAPWLNFDTGFEDAFFGKKEQAAPTRSVMVSGFKNGPASDEEVVQALGGHEDSALFVGHLFRTLHQQWQAKSLRVGPEGTSTTAFSKSNRGLLVAVDITWRQTRCYLSTLRDLETVREPGALYYRYA